VRNISALFIGRSAIALLNYTHKALEKLETKTPCEKLWKEEQRGI